MNEVYCSDRIAVIAGFGRYPELILDALIRQRITAVVLSLPGFDPKNKFKHLVIGEVSLETYLPTLSKLRGAGYNKLIFAGGVHRPHSGQDSTGVDAGINSIDVLGGDDLVLRKIVSLAEHAGFEVVGGQDLLPDLVPEAGPLTHCQPTEFDLIDADRGAEIVRSIGLADIGQAVVVANRLCIAVETVSGTDAMLDFAATTIGQFNPNPDRARGILYKAAKPQQELRLDMPAIGLDTIIRVAQIGLSGIVVEAGKVLLLDRENLIEVANQMQIFVWARQTNH